jgi:N-methylhydantoinase A
MTNATTKGVRSLFDPAVGDHVDAAIVARKDMGPGQGVHGPSIITEEETTIVVPSSCYALAQPDGCIDVIKTTQAHSHVTK